MDIVRTFGSVVAAQTVEHPRRARQLLTIGYSAQSLKYRVAPDRRLPQSRRYVARASIDVLLRSLKHPDRAVATSIFVPTEPLQAAGLHPYSVETVSAYLTGTKCEQAFLGHARAAGCSDTECSYHRVFLGALESGLVAPPKLAVYSNLACDGNLITFPHLHERTGVPTFLIDVPYEKSEESVADVARQLREMTAFVEDVAGVAVDEEALGPMMEREARTRDLLRRTVTTGAHRNLPSDPSSEMFPLILNHVTPGSKESLRYAELLAADTERAPESDGLRVLWMHLIPNMQPAVVHALTFSERVHLVYVDIAGEALLQEPDPAHPYESMARRMVYSPYNGNLEGRIEHARRAAEATDADGIVIFTQWGCKGTIGAAPLMKRRLEAAGFPCLVLDGDGCDQTNASDGQTATRLDAFFEMLEARRGAEEADGK